MSPSVDTSDLQYLDYEERFQELSSTLRNDFGCRFVFSMNRMRMMDDIRFAKSQEYLSLDVLFAGNENIYYRELFEDSDVFMLKSGSDFHDFTNLIILDGVKQHEYETYQEKIKQCPSGYDLSQLEVFYSANLQRMIVSERVNVDNRFSPEVKMFKTVKKCLEEYGKM